VIEAGTLHVSCLDLLHKVRHIIPLLNTLHVLGLRTTLWSVIKFAQCGHTIIFGDSTIRIIMHDGRPNSFELRLSHPFYQPRDHPFGYCIQASANCVTTIDPPSDATDSVVRAPYARTPKSVTVELLHNRLGHVSTKAILAANEASVWEDVTVRFSPLLFCIDCKVGTSCASNRGANRPGEILFCDVQLNPSKTGLTRQSYNKNYLEIVDLFSKHVAFIGTESTTASDIIACLKTWAHLHRPRPNFTLRALAELHVDAAPQLLSEELKATLKDDYGIRVISVAPKHQHQNGTPERRWQTTRQVAFKVMTHARVGLPFFDTALQQAALICNIVPIRGAF